MPIKEDNSTKITWRVEDFYLWVGESEVVWPSTPIINIENTEWQFKLCPRTVENVIAFSFNRVVNTDQDVNIHYTFYILGKDSSPYSKVAGISNLNPGDKHLVKLIHREELQIEDLPDDLFTIACDIRQLERIEPVNFWKSKWKDELETLSNDMRKLLETGYLSDLKLVSDDGCRIAVHSFVLIARWGKLCDSLSEKGFSTRIAVHGVSGSALYSFVSYLYSGTLSGSDVTAELFDFAVENAPGLRKLFYSRTSDICMRTHQRKEHLTFTWYADDLKEDSMPFYRVLPLHQVDGGDLEVVLDFEDDEEVGERCLAVTFSLPNLPEVCYITLNCTATLFIKDVCVKSLSVWFNFVTNEEWHFPSFIPMRLLTGGTGKRPTCPRVRFELVISDTPQQSVVESWVTEFHTGSRSIRNVELMTSDFRQFFIQKVHTLYDVVLRTEGGSFLSSRAVLSVRSRTFRHFFRNRRKGKITVGVSEMDSVALAGVLEYVYTGWTKLSTLEEVLKTFVIAKRLSLLGLVEKCEQFIDMHTRYPIHQTGCP